MTYCRARAALVIVNNSTLTRWALRVTVCELETTAEGCVLSLTVVVVVGRYDH
jgi:hypothetical protein